MLRARGFAAVVATAAFLSCGCGDDDGRATDAGGGGLDAGAGDASAFGPTLVAVAQPAAPAAPVLTPCPSGWRVVDAGGVDACEPWPDGGRMACVNASAHFPGEPACALVGTECPADGWPADLPVDAPVLFVNAGAPDGGTGTRDAPYATIGAAVAAAAPGTTIAVAAGAYDEIVRLSSDLTIVGACTGETVIASSEVSGNTSTFGVSAGEVTLRNVVIRGERFGVAAVGGAVLHLEDVIVENAYALGIGLTGAGTVVTGTNVVVRGTRSNADGRFGRGINVDTGATLRLTRAAIEENHDAGIVGIGPGATIEMSDVVVAATLPRSGDSWFGRGLSVQDGTTVTMTRVALEQNRHDVVFARSAGTTLRMTDVVVRDSEPNDTMGYFGTSVFVISGAHAELSRVRIARSSSVAFSVSEAGSTATVADVLIDELRPAPTGIGGLGVQVDEGAELTADRLAVLGALRGGVVANDRGTIRATDLIVRDVQGEPATGLDGRGLSGERQSVLEVTRAAIERCREFGVSLTNSSATLTDVSIVDVTPEQGTGEWGRGIHATEDSPLVAERLRIERYYEVGLFVDGPGSPATITDLTVLDGGDGAPETALAVGIGVALQNFAPVTVSSARVERARFMGIFATLSADVALEGVLVTETRERESDGYFGHALQVQRAARVTGRDVAIDHNAGFGVVTINTGSLVDLTDVRVSGTRRRDCIAGSCDPGGIGVAADDGADIVLTRFDVSNNVLCGVQVAEWGEVDLHEGVVSGHPIGVNVQRADFDTTRLTDRVTFVDNQRVFDAMVLPIPDAAPDVAAVE